MKVRNIVTLVVVILLVGAFIFIAGFNRLQSPIYSIQVEKIELWGRSSYEMLQREATDEEVKNIVKWFNLSTDIRENTNFAGETPKAGVNIYLRFSPDVRIIRSGGDFEVQRYNLFGINKSYWAKQSDIKKLLDQLASKGRV